MPSTYPGQFPEETGVPSAPSTGTGSNTGTGTMGLPGSWNQYAGPVGSILNFIGQTIGNATNNQQRGAALAAVQQGLGWLQSLGVENPAQLMLQAYGPTSQYGQSILDPMAAYQLNLLASGQNQLSQYQQQIPGFSQPNIGQYAEGPWGQQVDAMNRLAQQATGNYAGNSQPQFNNYSDILSSYLAGQHGGMQTLGNVGGEMLNLGGQNGYNMNAQNTAGGAISGGGWNPELQRLSQVGNELYSTGGMNPQLEAMTRMGMQGMANNGMTPGLSGINNYAMQNLMQNGGMSPQAQGFSNYAMQQLPQIMNDRQTQAGQFGPSGNAAIAGLLNPAEAPQLQTGVSPQQYSQAFQQMLGQAGQSNPGYTDQNMALFAQGNQGLNNLLARNGQMDQTFAAAQQAFGGGLPGGDPFQASIQDLIGQLSAGGFSGGGGVSAGSASGASAGGMLPMDADLQAMLKQGREYFANNPLLPMDQMVSMARDQAATAARQQAEAAQRFALSRGGGGAVINAGQQNQAMADFADRAMQAEAQAMRDAALKRQELGLTQQMQGGQIGIGASNADTNRQQVAASRDIASANNATQASIASANNQTQAGVANANLSLQQAAMRNAALQAAANAAVQARGQNYGQSQAGLAGMLSAMQTANQTGSIFNDAAKAGLTDATQRYGINAGLQGAAMGAIPGIMNANANTMNAAGNFQNQYQQNRNAANLGVLGGAIGASGQAATANNQAAQILASLGINASQLGTQQQQQLLSAALGANQAGVTNANNYGNLALGAQGTGTQRMGMGLTAMAQAPGMATNNLNAYGNIGNAASNDQLQRILAGAGMIGTQMQGQQQFGNLGINAANMGSQQGLNAATLAAQLYGQGAGQYGSMYGADLGNRQFAAGLNNNYLQGLNMLGGLSGGFTNSAMQPFMGMMNNMSGYSQAALNPYASLMNSYARMVSPQAFAPFANVPVQQGGTNYGPAIAAGINQAGAIYRQQTGGGGGGGGGYIPQFGFSTDPYGINGGFNGNGGYNPGGFGTAWWEAPSSGYSGLGGGGNSGMGGFGGGMPGYDQYGFNFMN